MDILSYIKTQREAGMPDEIIKKNLLSSGWTPESLVPYFPPRPEPDKSALAASPPSHVTMWDAFENIIAFICLYLLLGAILLCLNYAVDYYFPPLSANGINYLKKNTFSYYEFDYLYLNLALIILAYPIFAILTLHVKYKEIRMPALVNLHSRRSLSYLTMIGLFLMFFISAVTTIYKFFTGDLTSNFLAHVTVISIISTVVFIYLLTEVRKKTI